MPDQLAEEPLGAGGVALVAGGPGGEVERAAERPGSACLGEVLARRLERRLRVVELAPLQVQLAREAERPPARLGAAALLGEQDRLLDQRRGPVDSSRARYTLASSSAASLSKPLCSDARASSSASSITCSSLARSPRIQAIVARARSAR